MKTAIYAILYHCSYTDEKPINFKCPEGDTSWCFYYRAIAKKQMPNKHNESIKHLLQTSLSPKLCPYTRD